MAGCNFKNLGNIIDDEYFLVMNNTKVNKARLMGRKRTGGKVEILLVERLSDYEYTALIKGKINNEDVCINGDVFAHVIKSNEGKLHKVIFHGISGEDVMECFGTIPIPPYLKRDAESIDYEYYQTVYAKSPGSIAAPTAGLHFDQDLLTH